MSRTLWAIIIAFIIVLGVCVWIFFILPSPGSGPVVSTSTPATTTATSTAASTTATTTALHDRVHVTEPVAGAAVGQTFVVAGEAPGSWYFEASFPIEIVDNQGNIIAQTHAQALSDWMTTEEVPFSATTTITNGYTGDANVVIKRDNPSSLPENDDSVSVPIVIQ